MSHYTHLSIEEREKLYYLHGQGKSFREIARELKRAPSTITREYKRGRCWRNPYLPSRAQYRYEQRRKRCGRKPILSDPVYREKIRYYIEQLQWSPEQVSNRLKLEKAAFQISWISIYRAIWSGLLDSSQVRISHRKKADCFITKLRRKGKKRKKRGEEQKRGKFLILHTIEERSEGCTLRTELGHYECDTVAGKKGGARLLTLVDRTSRFTLSAKVPSSEASVTKDVMVALLQELPRDLVKSVTPDRGHEFAAYQEAMKSLPGVTFYFPPPYSPWERGTNENTNGLIREYSPKGTDIALLSDDDILTMLDKLNFRPRKCLNWKTPFEIHFDKLLHLT